MRTAKTHILKRDGKPLQLLSDHTVPLRAQLDYFKRMRVLESSDEISEVHYQESDGALRVLVLRSSKEIKARKDAQKKAEDDARKHAESEAKKEAKEIAEKQARLKAVEKGNTDADRKARAEAAKQSQEHGSKKESSPFS